MNIQMNKTLNKVRHYLTLHLAAQYHMLTYHIS